MAGVNSRAVRTGTMTPDERKKLSDAGERFATTRAIRIDDRPRMTVADIRRAARRCLRNGLALVVIDYLQLIQPEDCRVPREQQVARISRGLKNLSKELKVPIIAMMQLNRQYEERERPEIRHLRESAAVGHDAHVILLLHRPPDGVVDDEGLTNGGRANKKYIVRPWPAELIIAKNRGGEIGRLLLDWNPSETRFSCWGEREF